MKAVTRFVALDGVEFSDKNECVEYEHLCEEITAIMARLEPADGLREAEYVQQSGPVFLGVQRDLALVYERLYPGVKDHHTEYAVHATVPAGMTMIGRYIDDCGCAPLRRAWGRIARTDRKFREHSQTYYAIQADKAA